MHPFRSRLPTGVAFVTVAILVVACGTTAASAPVVTPDPSASASAAGSSAPTTIASSASGPSATASGATTAPFDPTGQTVEAEVILKGFDSPLDIADPGDGSGRLFVVEQGGRIRVVKAGTILPQPFLDISNRITSGGERGLLGLAFHPGFPTDPRFFVDSTDPDGNTVVSSWQISATNPDMADPASEMVLLHITQPFANHNGGAVQFGPDGMLYVALGDGGSGGDPQGNGQRLDTLLAKILRIDVDVPSGTTSPYVVPPDNPFVSNPQARPEIWLTGLRNPWRIRFDPPTGDLWIGDVGQNKWEEIDVARAGVGGLDYGWNLMEGFHCYQPADGCDQTGLTLPLAEYDHSEGCAVIGGVIVRDARQGLLNGGYLFGDACSDNLWLMDPNGDGRREPIIAAHLGRTLSSIGQAADGTVYATSLSTGELLRLHAPGR